MLLGVTQVMTRNWLTEFNISVDRFKGYLNDPYKITSIINSVSTRSVDELVMAGNPGPSREASASV